MKTITTFSGKEFLIEDEEAENIKKIFKPNTLLSLRNGEAVNTSAIESIGSLEQVPYWDNYLLEKSGRSFIRDGQRINLETKNFDEIEYKPHPKYEAMKEKLLENTKMFSDEQRTEISEKVAKAERNDDILVIE